MVKSVFFKKKSIIYNIMSSFYIDINAKNSKLLNDSNNRFRYELPNSINLPTGTQITCLQSIVNQQGITGASITIDEKITEKLIVQYYMKDTDYFMPTPKLDETTASTIGSWDAIVRINQHLNGFKYKGFPNFTNSYDATEPLQARGNYGHFSTVNNEIGGTEIPMPLLMSCGYNAVDEGNTSVANEYVIPFCGEIDIVINKGTYSVKDLSQYITEQINGVKLADFKNENYIKLQIDPDEPPDDLPSGATYSVPYRGFAINNTTIRSINTFSSGQASNFESGAAFRLEPYSFELSGGGGTKMVSPRPLTVKDNSVFQAVAFHPEFASECRKNVIQGYIFEDVGQPDAYKVAGLASRISPYVQMMNLLEARDLKGAEPDLSYDPTSAGVGVGATNFSLKYDEDGGFFSLDHLHSGRFIPTYDRFGNKMDSSGQECIFIKRCVGQNDDTRDGQAPARPDVNKVLPAGWSKTYSQPMTSSSGVMVLNWAYNTAKKYGTKPPIDGQREDLRAQIQPDVLENIDKFRLYDEWFDDSEKAQKAWENTLWYKLGFTYNDIQKSDNFRPFYQPDALNPNEIIKSRAEGFTTTAEIDPSLIPTISSMYNGQGHSASEPSAKGGIIPLNATINGIQTYNTLDINVPWDLFNNNKALETTLGHTYGGYKGSFYTGAVMIPVITTPSPVRASRLPILNDNGYMIVSTDIVEQNDIVKNKTNLGIIDLIPKSNLNNQDYVADRNSLTHTISNPKIINSINIDILNPDLTDINLEPNSSLLLQVVLPTPKQTLLIQNAVLQQAEQNVVQNASQLAQADQAKGNLVDIPQNLPYTTLDFTPEVLIEGTEEPTGEGGGGGVVETVEEVMRQQVRGLKDDPTLKITFKGRELSLDELKQEYSTADPATKRQIRARVIAQLNPPEGASSELFLDELGFSARERSPSPEPRTAGGGAKEEGKAKTKIFTKLSQVLTKSRQKGGIEAEIQKLAQETGLTTEFINHLPFRYAGLIQRGETSEAQELIKRLDNPTLRRFTISYAGDVREYEIRKGVKALGKIKLEDLPPAIRIKGELKRSQQERERREGSAVSTETGAESGVGTSIATEGDVREI